MRFATALSIALLTATPVITLADETPEEMALEARHGYMTMLGMNMGVLSAMAKGEMAYDEAAAQNAAVNIAALSQYNTPSLFIPGTAEGEIDDSEALPAIWENPEDFASKFQDLRAVAMASPEAVTGGQENVGAALQKLGGACKDCHDDYRKKD